MKNVFIPYGKFYKIHGFDQRVLRKIDYKTSVEGFNFKPKNDHEYQKLKKYFSKLMS